MFAVHRASRCVAIDFIRETSLISASIFRLADIRVDGAQLDDVCRCPTGWPDTGRHQLGMCSLRDLGCALIAGVQYLHVGTVAKINDPVWGAFCENELNITANRGYCNTEYAAR